MMSCVVANLSIHNVWLHVTRCSPVVTFVEAPAAHVNHQRKEVMLMIQSMLLVCRNALDIFFAVTNVQLDMLALRHVHSVSSDVTIDVYIANVCCSALCSVHRVRNLVLAGVGTAGAQ